MTWLRQTIHIQKEMHTKVLLENLKGRDHMEDPSIERKITFKWIFGGDDVEWTYLAWDRDQ
jgi:hypothetical protein